MSWSRSSEDVWKISTRYLNDVLMFPGIKPFFSSLDIAPTQRWAKNCWAHRSCNYNLQQRKLKTNRITFFFCEKKKKFTRTAKPNNDRKIRAKLSLHCTKYMRIEIFTRPYSAKTNFTAYFMQCWDEQATLFKNYQRTYYQFFTFLYHINSSMQKFSFCLFSTWSDTWKSFFFFKTSFLLWFFLLVKYVVQTGETWKTWENNIRLFEIHFFIYKQLGPYPSPQSYLYFQDFQGSKLFNSCLVLS